MRPNPLAMPDTTDMTMTAILREAQGAVRRAGLTGWTVHWIPALPSIGQCNYTTRRLSLSPVHYRIIANRADARDTVLHEIAHALVGPEAGHGPVWQTMAASLGAVPEPTASMLRPVVGRCGCPGRRRETDRVPPWSPADKCGRCGAPMRWSVRAGQLD